MGIADRLRARRRVAGLNQRELAEAVGVSAMAVSKYERGIIVPSSSVLLRLAKVFNVKVEYFFRPTTVSLSKPCFRRRVALSEREEEVLQAQIQEWLERYLEVEILIGEPVAFELRSGLLRGASSLEDVERVALDLREKWDLGLGPIENLTEVLEDKGIKVGVMDSRGAFDALTCFGNDRTPVIVVRQGMPGDRQRFSLSHELAHLVLQTAEGIEVESAAYRFGGAFLAPEPTVRLELGDRRHALDPYELHLLKHKYGISMQSWIHRARELNIITKSVADAYFALFRSRGWTECEPGDAIQEERTERMTRLVLHALAEDLISESRAAELLGTSPLEFLRQEAERHGGFPVGMHL